MKLKQYNKYLFENNYSINTIKTYMNILKKYINIINNASMLKKEITKYYYNPNTAWTHYNTICSYLKWENSKQLQSLRKLKLPKIPKLYFPVFSKEYLHNKTIINIKDSEELKIKKYLIRFLFETGIRVSEIYSILTYNKNTLTVKGKGNKIREIFHNYKTTTYIKYISVSSKTIRIWVKEILGKAFTPHSIRRSMATHLLTNGANPKMVMLQLGHEKIETTYRYLHVSLEDNLKIYNSLM